MQISSGLLLLLLLILLILLQLTTSSLQMQSISDLNYRFMAATLVIQRVETILPFLVF